MNDCVQYSNELKPTKRNAPNFYRSNSNPIFGNRMQLFCKTNYNLAVYPNGMVKGTLDDDDPYSHLQLYSAGSTSHLRLRGLATDLYIAMDDKGHLYGEANSDITSTIFVETFQGSYNTYKSSGHDWYIAIKKSGEHKPGPETAYGQNAIMFLPRRSKFV